HYKIRLLEESNFYSNWIRCGRTMVCYLPMCQFGYVQTIPRHPTISARPMKTQQQVDQHHAQFLDRVLTSAQRAIRICIYCSLHQVIYEVVFLDMTLLYYPDATRRSAKASRAEGSYRGMKL
ncbi:hypothetical protein L195_g057341, partial [Trifolium pratense]